MKNCFGSTFDNFLGKGGVLRQKLTSTFLITNEILNILLFSSSKKKLYFLKKQQKTVSVVQVFFEGKEASGEENEYNLFYGK